MPTMNDSEIIETREHTVQIINNETIAFNSDIETYSVDDFIGTLAAINNSLLQNTVAYPSYSPRINLLFSTDGGSVYDAFRMYDAIAGNRIPVHIYSTGLVASSGLIILCSSNHRYTFKNTQFLFHQMSGGMSGTHQQIRGHYHHAEKLNLYLQQIFTEQTKLTLEEIKTFALEEHWFDAQLALQYGFVNEIVEKSII